MNDLADKKLCNYLFYFKLSFKLYFDALLKFFVNLDIYNAVLHYTMKININNDSSRNTVVQSQGKPRSVLVTALQFQSFSERECIKQDDES